MRFSTVLFVVAVCCLCGLVSNVSSRTVSVNVVVNGNGYNHKDHDFARMGTHEAALDEADFDEADFDEADSNNVVHDDKWADFKRRAGFGSFKEGTSTVLNVLPGIGIIKNTGELIIGKDIVTGEERSRTESAIGVGLGLVPGLRIGGKLVKMAASEAFLALSPIEKQIALKAAVAMGRMGEYSLSKLTARLASRGLIHYFISGKDNLERDHLERQH